MPIEVTYYTGGKKGVQRLSIDLPEPQGPLTIRDFLTYVTKNRGTNMAEVESHMQRDNSHHTLLIALNGRNIQSLRGMDTLIRDGDSLSVLPVVAGGQSEGKIRITILSH